MAVRIPLINPGLFTWVSEEDLPRILAASIEWRLNKGYVATKIEGKEVRLHRLITNCPKGLEVDHLDENKLNNCRWNLEIVTHSENMKRMWANRKRRQLITV
jgi:hypothetical protein